MENRAVIAWISLVVVLDGLAALFGGLLPEQRLRSWRPYMFGFASGTLLVSGAADVLPEAIARRGGVAVVWAVASFLALAVFEHVTTRRRHHAQTPVHPVALLGSDAFHNLGDGMAIAAAFLVSPQLGISTSVAVIVHELPEELADYALLRAAGLSKRAALASLAAVQLTSGLGAAAALVATRWVAGIEGIVLAIAAGMFVYIGAIDLLPEVARTRTIRAWGAFVAGAVVALLA